MEVDKCIVHHDKAADKNCQSCGVPICSECTMIYKDYEARFRSKTRGGHVPSHTPTYQYCPGCFYKRKKQNLSVFRPACAIVVFGFVLGIMILILNDEPNASDSEIFGGIMFFIIISVIAILFCILYIIKIPERTGRYNQKIEAFSQSISNPQKIVVSNQPNKAFSCQQCGREIGTNADFCTHCGNRVN